MTLFCKNCNVILKKNRKSFCSRKCQGEHLKREDKVCVTCGKIYCPCHPYQRFCSRKCSRKLENKLCEYCKCQFHPKLSKQRFCSLECVNENRKTCTETNCTLCDKVIYIMKHKIDKQKTFFCCWDHANKWSKRNQIKLICKVCEKDFWVQQSRKDALCCSFECLQKLKVNNFEELAYQILKDNNIDFIPQFVINNKFTVDAFVPSKNLIIQLDGDYWHGKPDKYPTPNKLQAKNINRDKSQDEYMKKCGHKMVRIWESELRNDNNLLMNLINTA